MEEHQAIALLKSGNLDGLAVLVQRYYFQAVRASYLIVQDNAQAEDIVQTAFLHASEKINQLNSERFGPWFMKMAVNASIKVAEKQKRQVSLDAGGDAEVQYLAEWLVDQRPSVEEMVETEELRRDVWNALTRLTPQQRAAVVLKYYLDFSEAEITQQLRKPLSTIKWTMFAARRKLQSLLRPRQIPPDPAEPQPIRCYSEPWDKEHAHER